jgi:hypothetical protein
VAGRQDDAAMIHFAWRSIRRIKTGTGVAHQKISAGRAGGDGTICDDSGVALWAKPVGLWTHVIRLHPAFSLIQPKGMASILLEPRLEFLSS